MMSGRFDLSIPATNTAMTLRRRTDRILRGEILGQKLGKEGVSKCELSKSVRQTLMSPYPDWNRGSVTARARFRLVRGKGMGRWRGGLAGKMVWEEWG